MGTVEALCRVLAGSVLLSLLSGNAFGGHVDPAPMSDEVVVAVQHYLQPTAPDQLPVALSQRLAEIGDLLNQLGNASIQSSAPQLSLLSAEIQELSVIREEAKRRQPGSQPSAAAVPGNLDSITGTANGSVKSIDAYGGLDGRFQAVINAIQAVVSSPTDAARKQAIGAARKLLVDLQPRQPDASGPVPMITQAPPKVRNLPQKVAPPPKYLAYRNAPNNNIYAFLGNTLIAPPVLQPTPAEASTCNFVHDGSSQDDLNANAVDVQIPQEIKDLAASLGYSPVKILQYVSANIAFEPYWGSLKGSVGTLWSKTGGATDQASLLIALLRASNIPARYVQGQISFDHDPRVLNWLGAKDYPAAGSMLKLGEYTNVHMTQSSQHIDFPHVWVEACVPYGNYRGNAIDKTGHRWIPMDPSFKEKTYQAGIAVSGIDLSFTGPFYTNYMAKRTNGPDSLPQEAYARQVESVIKQTNPNATLQDVPYTGTQVTRKFDILPASLPYTVSSFIAWSGTSSSEIAQLPDFYRYRLEITTPGFAAPVTFFMPTIVLNRLTLSYKGATTTDSTGYESLLSGTYPVVDPASSCPTTHSSNVFCTPPGPVWIPNDGSAFWAYWTEPPLSLKPVIKIDGVENNVGTPLSYWTYTPYIFPTMLYDVPTINTVSFILRLGTNFNDNSSIVNSATYTNKVDMRDIYDIEAYAFQASDRLLTARAARLLQAIKSNPVDTNRDETIGEFLHLAGLKYMRYLTDAGKRLGDLRGESGLNGNHIGMVSTLTKTSYLFDMPFGVPNNKGLLVDVVGGQTRSVDLVTGLSNDDSQFLFGYAGSAYEAYLWQENARLDAVSTVRGLQFAKETGIPVLTLTPSSATRAADLASLGTGSHPYSPADIQGFTNDLNTLGSSTVIILPQNKILYNNWYGEVYFKTWKVGASTYASYAISGNYQGGYSLGPILSGFSNLDFSNFSAGALPSSLQTIPGWYSPNVQSSTATYIPAALSSAVGLGQTPYTIRAGDPVNMVNGNMYHNERDIALKGRGLPIVFERAYNSREAKDGPLGYGWTHSFNHFLTFKDDNADGATNSGDTDGVTSSVSWTDGTGSEKFIPVTGSSSGVAVGSAFTPPKGFFFATARNNDGTYSIREKNGVTYTFESVAGTVGQKARLLNIADRNNNKLILSYVAATGCDGTYVCKVTDGLGRALTFTYDASKHITQIQDWSARSYQYVYINGNLTSFKNPLAASGSQNPVTYQYYSAASAGSPNLDHAMQQYTLPRGNGMNFEYYMNGKVFRHTEVKIGGALSNAVNTFTYNDFRRETVQISERGYTRRFFFDQYGNPLQIIEENGAIREYTYDPDPAKPYNRLSKRDPEGYVTSYQYDSNGNVIKITNPSAGTSTVEYSYFNNFGQPGKVKDARGNFALYKFDNNGNLLQGMRLNSGIGASYVPTSYSPVASDLAAWTVNTYDSWGNLATTKRMRDFSAQAGPLLSYNYNDTVNNVQGLNLVQIIRTGAKDSTLSTLGTDTSSVLVYDNLGRVTTGIDADWQTLAYQYDAVDRPKRAMDALGNWHDNRFDANGNPVQEQISATQHGVPTLLDSSSARYDDADRKIASIDTGGNATAYDYDLGGNITQITDPDNYSLSIAYDPDNHVTQANDKEGHAVARTLDLEGKPRSVTDPNGNTTNYVYYGPEKDGRLKSQTDANNHVTTYDYDANGNAISVTVTPNDSSAARVTLTQYDALNRPVRVVGPVTTNAALSQYRPVTRYTYDNLGNLIAVTAGQTDITGTNSGADVVATQMTYVYDDFSRKLKETDPLSRSWSYLYDINNNVTRVTDAKNQATQYTWNPGHQLVSLKDAVGKTTTYIRNPLGQVLTVQTPDASTRYAYDQTHRLASATDNRAASARIAAAKTLNYSYSPGGLLNTLTDSEGNRTDYLYDPTGRLDGIWAPNLDYVSYTYDAGGRLTEKWFPNGINTQYAYNTDNTLTQLTNRIGYSAAATVTNHRYTYDGVGNRKTGQDQAGPLQSPAMNQASTYDPLNNRVTQSDGSTTLYAQYDAANQLIGLHQGSLTGPLTAAYIYDANGSLTQKCAGGTITQTLTSCTGNVITTLTWDAQNRLIQADKTGQPTQTYAYDDQGRRIRKSVGTTTTNYLYNGPDIYAEYTSWTAPNALYTDGPNTDEPVIRQTTSGAQYYHQDGLGSVVAMTDATGNLTGAQLYDAWGNTQVATGTVSQYGYTGREPDETGLIYYRARYYDPSIGRFTSRDPIGLGGGVNQYAYVGNNPVNLIDPLGLLPKIQLADATSAINYYSNTVMDFGNTLITSGAQKLGQAWDSSPAVTIGKDFAALAAKLQSTVTGDQALGNTADQVLAENRQSNVDALFMLGTLGRGGVKLGAPAYSVAFETTIAEAGVGTRASHFTDANKSLAAAMKNDAGFANIADSLGIQIPNRLSQSPADWSWHHVSDQPGVMQLVPRSQHQGGPWQPLLHPNQEGGFRLWGSQY